MQQIYLIATSVMAACRPHGGEVDGRPRSAPSAS